MLTASLSVEIERANLLLDRWVERKNEWLDTSDSAYRAQVEECACIIQALKENEFEMENIREQQIQIKEEQQEEIAANMEELKRLTLVKEELQAKLEAAQKEEEKERVRLLNAKDEYKAMNQKLDHSIEHLMIGLRKYSALGLQFERSEGESMVFKFTQIDPQNHIREFTFTIYVDANDAYVLVETSPRLDARFCEATMKQLNVDNDLRKFVVTMRKAFCQLVSRFHVSN